MSDTNIGGEITPEDIKEAERYSLGPAYFSAHRAADAMLAAAENEVQPWEKLITKVGDELVEYFRMNLEEYALANLNDHIQGHIWRAVEDCVQGILTGETWALKRFGLDGRYDNRKVRLALVEHCRDGLAPLINEELADEVKRLRELLDMRRRL